MQVFIFDFLEKSKAGRSLPTPGMDPNDLKIDNEFQNASTYTLLIDTWYFQQKI